MLKKWNSDLFNTLGNRRSHDSNGHRRLRMEMLEPRQMLAAQPIVTLSAPDEVFIGESVQLTASFDNADATDAGYGPVCRCVLAGQWS